MSTEFSINLIKNNLKEWIDNPRNERRFFTRPQERILQFSHTGSGDPAPISLDLRWVSIWHLNCGLHEILQARNESQGDVVQSSLYAYWRVRVLYNIFTKLKTESRRSMLRHNEAALALGQLMALGLFREAESLRSIITNGIEEGFFHQSDPGQLQPFLLSLLASREHKETNLEQANGFHPLFDNWRTTDQETWTSITNTACDFHIDRSRESNDQENYEFEDEAFRAFPIEILATMRMRELVNLPHLVTSHPLMASPIGDLESMTHAYPDHVLSQFVTTFRSTT